MEFYYYYYYQYFFFKTNLQSLRGLKLGADLGTQLWKWPPRKFFKILKKNPIILKKLGIFYRIPPK